LNHRVIEEIDQSLLIGVEDREPNNERNLQGGKHDKLPISH